MENNENIALSEETAAPCGADTKRSFGNIVKHYADRYFIKALGAMAKGLFASLLIGTIIAQFARIPALSGILDPIVKVAQNGFVVGGAIGAAIAVGLGAKALTLCAAVVAGAIGYTSGAGGAGPVGAYIAAVIGIEIGRLVEGKTKVDILLVPIAVLLTGGVVGVLLGAPLGAFMKWLGYIIGKATYLNPIPMGIIVSVVMGIILTAPISSAAIASMIFVTANAAPDVKTGLMLAAGAATIGCCCNMVGFAVASYRENKFGGLVAQGLGTSMLQVPNIMRHPLIWLPVIFSSAILGPVSTIIANMQNNATGSGMGSAGLVGQITTYQTMIAYDDPKLVIIKIILLHFVLPAVITLFFSEVFRKANLIKSGDMALNL